MSVILHNIYIQGQIINIPTINILIDLVKLYLYVFLSIIKKFLLVSTKHDVVHRFNVGLF